MPRPAAFQEGVQRVGRIGFKAIGRLVLADRERQLVADRILHIGIEQIDGAFDELRFEPPFEFGEGGAFEAEAGAANIGAVVEVISATAAVIAGIVELEGAARLEGEIAVDVSKGRGRSGLHGGGSADLHILDAGFDFAVVGLEFGVARFELLHPRFELVEPIEHWIAGRCGGLRLLGGFVVDRRVEAGIFGVGRRRIILSQGRCCEREQSHSAQEQEVFHLIIPVRWKRMVRPRGAQAGLVSARELLSALQPRRSDRTDRHC